MKSSTSAFKAQIENTNVKKKVTRWQRTFHTMTKLISATLFNSRVLIQK